MRITFRANTSRNRVQESSSLVISAKLWDDSSEAWTAYTPTSLKYRLDCITSGNQVLDWTTLTPAASSSITITGTQNAIVNNCNEWETKQLTVKANDGLSTQYQGTFSYDVRNLSGQT